MSVHVAALAAHDAGLCVLPVKQDGTKAPDVPSWTSRQTIRSSRDEIDRWFADGRRSGLGYVTGAVSGNLELLDFDDLATYKEFRALAESAGLAPLLDRVREGYLEQSPGGVHLLYRCEAIAGNTKLARRIDEAGVIHGLIETRGEGGYVVVAPSNGRVHPSGGTYRLVRGGVGSIATISAEERDELHALARSLDAMPKEKPRGQADTAEGSGKPGDDYNQRGDVLALLEDRGWAVVFERNGVMHLRRPGKDRGTSATFATINGKRYFYVFTTSTAFESEKSHSPFKVYATLEHDGDFAEAARALLEQGYGEPAATIRRGGSQATPDPARPWPVLDPAALYGLAGDVVRTIEPHTEGDPVAVGVNFLVMFGSAAGRTPHARVGAARHRGNLYAIHVGETARARKGTAHGEAQRVMVHADPDWKGRIQGGLSSGEGLIHTVRDPIWKPNKEGEMKLVDPGVDDKRLLVVEPEYSSVLRVATRDGNTLSELVRRGWDGDDLRTLTRAAPLTATGPHISILGHITIPELLRELSETYQANGFANRNLFVCVRRSKELPHGGALSDADVDTLAARVHGALDFARRTGEVRRDAETDRVWEGVYSSLTAPRPGLLGAITARAEAQVLRLSLVYALLDLSREIRRVHLEAALALWQYAEDSARFIFGDAIGSPVADQILSALRRTGRMTQTQISDLFARNQKAGRLEQALAALLTAGLVRTWQGEATSGRPPTYWEAV